MATTCCFRVIKGIGKRPCWFDKEEEEDKENEKENDEEQKKNAHTPQHHPRLVLMEIVGALGLLSTLLRKKNASVHPYCIVKIGKAEVHRTKVIRNDANPIWTVRTNALCLLKIPENDENNALTIEVKSGSKILGTVVLEYDQLINQKGDRRDHPIQQQQQQQQQQQPTVQENAQAKDDTLIQPKAVLALRFRPATYEDLEFLTTKTLPAVATTTCGGSSSMIRFVEQQQQQHHASHSRRDLASTDINFKQSVRQSSLFQQAQRKDHGGASTRLYRTKPFADPDRPPEETEWMSGAQLQAESLKPSTKWTSVGGGSAGTIFLEILACQDLVNMDSLLPVDIGALGVGVGGVGAVPSVMDLTDAFCAIVFEDNMVRTDVIWDDLNPKWMPWTSRAFAFQVRHPTSILMLGIFDYDLTGSHDPVGRIVISTANFSSHTTYLLHYKLGHDPRHETDDNKASSSSLRGTITIRLRIEWHDEVEAMLHALGPPRRYIINVDNSKSYNVLRYLTRGSIDMEQASLASVQLYVNELLSYWMSYCYFLDVVLEVLLWRGQLGLGGKNNNYYCWFPIHSVAMFAAVVLAIEYPQNAVAIAFYFVAWVLISINYHLSRSPCPWKRVKSFGARSVVGVLAGRKSQKPCSIEPNQGVDEQARLEKLDQLKAARMSSLIQELLRFALSVYGIYSKTSDSSTEVTTERKSWSPLEGQLRYLHLMLKLVTKFFRVFRNIVNWNTYTSQTLTMFCVWSATLWLALPIDKAAGWLIRIVAWTLLGPWMKLVDIRYFHSWYRTKEELLKDIDAGVDPELDLPDFDALLESDMLINMGRSGRVVAENSLKLKDMRELLFGSYGEIIPAIDSSRNPSVPLPQSFAFPTKETSDKNEEKKEHWCHVPGQQLCGEMVMALEDNTVSAVPSSLPNDSLQQ